MKKEVLVINNKKFDRDTGGLITVRVSSKEHTLYLTASMQYLIVTSYDQKKGDVHAVTHIESYQREKDRCKCWTQLGDKGRMKANKKTVNALWNLVGHVCNDDEVRIYTVAVYDRETALRNSGLTDNQLSDVRKILDYIDQIKK